MSRQSRMDSPFLIKRSAMPPSPRAALKQLQPRAEQTQNELVRNLRTLARALENEAMEIEKGAMRPSHNMIAPYAAALDRMRAEANLLREWTQTLRGEIVGPITPYMGNAVIPSVPVSVEPLAPPRPPAVPTPAPTDTRAAHEVEAEAGGTGPSIAELMEQVAAGHQG